MSSAASISDLDGYSFRDYHFPSNTNYSSAQDEDFGFDPPSKSTRFQIYSPPAEETPQWPIFEHEDDVKPSTESVNLDAYEMDKFITAALPTTHTAVSRFGQMTPPRSSSNASIASKEEKLSPKANAGEAKKRGKPRTKEAETPSDAPAKRSTAGRKRKAPHKPSIIPEEKESAPEEQRRKQSLEKNRLAAAKCRVNKKEKTERLQQDSHDKAVQNALLKDEVMRLKEEVQQMNTILVAHASCGDGCKTPADIQSHFNKLGNDFFNQQLVMQGQNFGDYQQMSYGGLSDSYFPSSAADSLLHPPLPEFNRSADFDVHTPLPTG